MFETKLAAAYGYVAELWDLTQPDPPASPVGTYPSGGGSYEVASTNLGPAAGLIVASALMVDYVLTVAVSISSGTAAITSAFPAIG